MTVHVGTSGWSHSHWEHVLYPPGLPSRERLGHYVQRFDTVELNSSFYRWPRSTAFASWRRRLPEGFALYLLEQLPAWMRVAVEFRHPSWHADEVFALLATHQAAYCVMSGAQLPCVLAVTAPFVYVRLHGPDHQYLYGGSYSDADIGWWADRVREWDAMGKDVFVYFNNDGDGNAVRNAQSRRHALRV